MKGSVLVSKRKYKRSRFTFSADTGSAVGMTKIMLTKSVQIQAQMLIKRPAFPIYHGPGSNLLNQILQKIGMQ